MNTEIQKDFTLILEENFPTDAPMTELLRYACLPPGKLFRPKLTYALAHDLNGFNPDHKLLAAAIEVHHAYSLVHDDLPSMDNDDMRRGKPSLHKAYNEWKAILSGDALIGFSFELLSQMQSDKTIDIINLFARYTGKDGLILGQFLDLSHDNDTFEKLCHLHLLKTGKLISFALEASFLLIEKPLANFDQIKLLGSSLGLLFQLIDDLSELNEDTDQHEEDINAFLNFPANKVIQAIVQEHKLIKMVIKENKLENLNEIYKNYLIKMIAPLDATKISKKINYDIKEIINFID